MWSMTSSLYDWFRLSGKIFKDHVRANPLYNQNRKHQSVIENGWKRSMGLSLSHVLLRRHTVSQGPPFKVPPRGCLQKRDDCSTCCSCSGPNMKSKSAVIWCQMLYKVVYTTNHYSAIVCKAHWGLSRIERIAIRICSSEHGWCILNWTWTL